MSSIQINKDAVQMDDCHGQHNAIDTTQTYTANTADLDNSFLSRQVVLGVLAVPFKYYKWGDRSFTGNSSVGGYLGYKSHFDKLDANATFILFGGATTISVPNNGGGGSGSTAQSSNVSGGTIGLGVVVELGSGTQAQAGVSIGRDYVSANANWVNNGHGWIAFQIGYEFHQ